MRWEREGGWRRGCGVEARRWCGVVARSWCGVVGLGVGMRLLLWEVGMEEEGEEVVQEGAHPPAVTDRLVT